MFVIKRIEEIVYLPEELLGANEDSPCACASTSFVPEDFAVIFSHAALILELMFIFVNFFLQIVILDSDEISHCFAVVLLG